MFLLGSAYPTAKLGLNASIPPILFGAIRMAIVFIFLIPFCKIELPNKKYLLPLLGFSLCMGVGVNLFLYLSVNVATILSPIVIGAQLSIPLAIVCSSMFIGESISYKKWILIITSFIGIILIGFDPKIVDEILGILLICCMAFFYGLAQVFSRYLKELNVKFTNAFMGLVGCIVLLTLSILPSILNNCICTICLICYSKPICSICYSKSICLANFVLRWVEQIDLFNKFCSEPASVRFCNFETKYAIANSVSLSILNKNCSL